MNKRERKKIEPRVIGLATRCGIDIYTTQDHGGNHVVRMDGLYESLLMFYKNAYDDGRRDGRDI